MASWMIFVLILAGMFLFGVCFLVYLMCKYPDALKTVTKKEKK